MKELHQKISDAKAEGRRLIFIDETMFTRKTVAKLEWARKHENAEVDDRLLKEKTYALLMGISEEAGVEQYKIFSKSVNTDKFLEYLQLVREAHGDRPLALFMDNLSCHRTIRAREKM